MKIVNVSKAATFKVLFSKVIKKNTVTIFVAVLFNIFMRQTLTDDFWHYTKIGIARFL